MTDFVRARLASLSVVDSDTIKTLMLFSCAGLLVSLLFMLSGIDLGPGF
jgi:hypothetical protein